MRVNPFSHTPCHCKGTSTLNPDKRGSTSYSFPCLPRSLFLLRVHRDTASYRCFIPPPKWRIQNLVPCTLAKHQPHLTNPTCLGQRVSAEDHPRPLPCRLAAVLHRGTILVTLVRNCADVGHPSTTKCPLLSYLNNLPQLLRHLHQTRPIPPRLQITPLVPAIAPCPQTKTRRMLNKMVLQRSPS